MSLVVDNFTIKYTSKDDADHLLDTLRGKYEISIDWDTKLYIGIVLNWDYTKGTVTLLMSDYVKKALQKFKHILPSKAEYAPHDHVTPAYGAK